MRYTRKKYLPAVRPAAPSWPAAALGAVAVGALACGALAIGALAVGRLAIRRARIRRLEVDELSLRSLQVGQIDMRAQLEPVGAGPLGAPVSPSELEQVRL